MTGAGVPLRELGLKVRSRRQLPTLATGRCSLFVRTGRS